MKLYDLQFLIRMMLIGALLASELVFALIRRGQP